MSSIFSAPSDTTAPGLEVVRHDWNLARIEDLVSDQKEQTIRIWVDSGWDEPGIDYGFRHIVPVKLVGVDGYLIIRTFYSGSVIQFHWSRYSIAKAGEHRPAFKDFRGWDSWEALTAEEGEELLERLTAELGPPNGAHRFPDEVQFAEEPFVHAIWLVDGELPIVLSCFPSRTIYGVSDSKGYVLAE
jgi:hypothetical protein